MPQRNTTEDALLSVFTLKVSIQTFHSTIIYSNQMIQMPNETENKHVKEYILTHMTFN